jgi:hypothetical protein
MEPQKTAPMVRGLTYPMIRDAIYHGELDDYLDELSAQIFNRRRRAGQQKSYELELGDIIVISNNCKPKLLANTQVIFRGREASKLKVELTRTVSQKWRRGSIIRIPVSLVGDVIKKEN